MFPAPTTNLFCKFGVPFDPLHNAHPEGIEPVEPLQRIIPPTGVIPPPPPETFKFPTVRVFVEGLYLKSPSLLIL